MSDQQSDQPFSASQISGPRQEGSGKALFYYDVTLPDGRVGHAVIGPGDVHATIEQVTAELNFLAVGHGYDAVVNDLLLDSGLRISPLRHP